MFMNLCHTLVGYLISFVYISLNCVFLREEAELPTRPPPPSLASPFLTISLLLSWDPVLPPSLLETRKPLATCRRFASPLQLTFLPFPPGVYIVQCYLILPILFWWLGFLPQEAKLYILFLVRFQSFLMLISWIWLPYTDTLLKLICQLYF